jgi:O-antigen ligase
LEVTRRFSLYSLPFIERWGTTLWTWGGIIIVSCVAGLLNVTSHGNVLSIVMLVGVAFIIGLSLLRPTMSLYLLAFLALAIEQVSDYYSWTFDIPYHKNLNNIHPRLSGIAMNPLELHLAFIIVGMGLRFSLLKEKPLPILVKGPLYAYASAIIFFVIYGILRGGATLPAIWEVRGIFYLFALMAVVPQLIRTREQVSTMLWTIVAALSFRAFEVSFHFVRAGFTLEGSTGGWGSHEDAGLQATFVVFVASLYVLKLGSKKQRLFLTLMLVPVFLAIVASDRRTVYPVFAACFLLIAVMMPGEFQKKILRVGWKLGILFIIYVAVFWNSRSESIFLMPVKNIREGLAGEDQEAAGESYSSNLYRKVENYDLFNMIKSQPILGHGYGMLLDYRMPVPVQWELGFYIPHNQILAVYAKTGSVGFLIFLLFYLSVAARIARGFGELDVGDFHRAILVLAGAAIVNHLVYSFFDIMLTYYRNNVYLGILLGLAGVVIALRREEMSQAPAAPPVQEEVPTPPVHRLLQPHSEEVSLLRLRE